MSLSNVLPIYKKELRGYFSSPVAYIVLTVFLLICGWFFSARLFVEGEASLRSVFPTVLFLLTLFVPAITMGLLSEERKSGTFELLATMPVEDIEIVVGKYLAALTLLATAFFFTLTYAVTVKSLGDADVGVMFTGYVGLLLLGAGQVAIGVLASSLTENQVVAFIVSFLILFILSFIDVVLPHVPAAFASVFEYLSATYHFTNISRGVLDTRDLVYFASIVVLSLYLAARALQRRI